MPSVTRRAVPLGRTVCRIQQPISINFTTDGKSYMRTSPKYLAVLILIFFIVIQANASILFVRAGSSGDGSSWANAWGNFGSINWSSVGAGSIVCVAGGTYSDSLNTGASGVSGNPVLIKRAVTSDPSCGSSTAGWSPNFDSQVVMNGTITLQNNFVTIDG